MADRVESDQLDERPRDTVVVKEESKSNAGWIILAVLAILVLLYLLMANPFSNSDTDGNVDVNVPSPTVNTPTPQAPAE